MQSGYGGVSEMQQFLVDGCAPTLFSISPPPPPSNPAAGTDVNSAAGPSLKYHPHFPHFHPIPITQQFFHQNHHHYQYQLFQHQHPPLGLEQNQPGPEPLSSPSRLMGGRAAGSPSYMAAAVNFKLAVDESGGGGSNDGHHIMQGEDPWQREESTIKEPFWRPLDINYINPNNKRLKDKEPESSTNGYCKRTKEGSSEHHPAINESNYKIFSELEAIYKPGSTATTGAGSGSALTGEETPLLPTTTVAAPAGDTNADHESDTSTGEAGEPAALPAVPRRRRKKRRRQQQLSSIAAFFERLVKQLMEQQEELYRKFLEVVERRDEDRRNREESWRRQEAANAAREAAARTHERALAAAREASIVSFLEKITGETLNHIPPNYFDNQEALAVEPSDAMNVDRAVQKRWPRAEVQALIRVRSGLEPRFQEPGLKGPLWEEVSLGMQRIGSERSAKRCKEKWENINKYFRKTKESGKDRPLQSKTCPYFDQLDQLYSKAAASDDRPSFNLSEIQFDGDEGGAADERGPEFNRQIEEAEEDDGGGDGRGDNERESTLETLGCMIPNVNPN